MEQSVIPNIAPGTIVGQDPTFEVNAFLEGDFLYVRDAHGRPLPGRTVDIGDRITVLDVSTSTGLALIQYPTSRGYVQGYVTNDTDIIKYINGYNWSNGSTTEYVYDLDKVTRIGSLDPGEKAVKLFTVNNGEMTAVVYDTGKGKVTKSGLVKYAGTENSSSSNSGNSFNGIKPGGIVPGGFSYKENAEVVGDELYLRDQDGNLIQGCSVSVGDKITVLDVGYTKQLALVQYPAGNVVKQGYVTNATNLIRYFNPYEWHNGSTGEEVLDENGHQLGSLSAYESATPLYKKDNLTHVVYDTDKGPNTKSGFVRYVGSPGFSDSGIGIPDRSYPGVEKITYGSSGKNRPLTAYKIGNGDKVLFAGFAIHGWEDNEPNDGLILVKIAHDLISKFSGYNSQYNGLHGWTVYIAPCMNPDGVIVNGTNNGPGRCAVTTRVDMNRCFPYNFTPQYSPRNYTGPTELLAPEARALRDYILEIKPRHSEMVVLDFHGWMNFTQGNPELGQYFCNQFGFNHNTQYSAGFFSCWANELKNTKGVLIEYPGYTHSYKDAVDNDFSGKTFNAILNMLKDNPGANDSTITTNNNPETNNSTVITTNEKDYNATGTVINVTSHLNVRQGPGKQYAILGRLYQGNAVTIVAENNFWYKIKFGSSYAYVDSYYIHPNTGGSSTSISSNDSAFNTKLSETASNLMKTLKIEIEEFKLNKSFFITMPPFDIEYEFGLQAQLGTGATTITIENGEAKNMEPVWGCLSSVLAATNPALSNILVGNAKNFFTKLTHAITLGSIKYSFNIAKKTLEIEIAKEIPKTLGRKLYTKISISLHNYFDEIFEKLKVIEKSPILKHSIPIIETLLFIIIMALIFGAIAEISITTLLAAIVTLLEYIATKMPF